jgi:hypothetical protein
MYNFTIKDVDQGTQCIPCCCESLSMKPGSTNKVSVNYAPWAVPIGRLHCLPAFDLVQMQTCPDTGQPVIQEPVQLAATTNATLLGDLRTFSTDQSLTFKSSSLYGPWHGILELDVSGTFTYTPNSGYTGEDRFYATATNTAGNQTTFEVMLGVGVDETAIKPTPHVSVDPVVNVNYQYYIASFAVKVSPAANLCEVWRLNIQMHSIDCECVCFDRTDCFDIRMVKC